MEMHRTDRSTRREILGLSLLFGAMYFAQGIGEPTEGLIAQPVRSLLAGWGHSPGAIGTFAAVLALPWAIKPLYGLLTDFVPLAGYRRRSYLVLASLAATVGLLVLYATPLTAGSLRWLLALLLVPTVGVAFSDVVVDAVMVERGQRLGRTGQFQSVQWACNYGAMILTGYLGGLLSRLGWQKLGFLLCALATGATLLLAFFFVREQPAGRSPPGQRFSLKSVWQALRSPAVLAVGAFLFLWNFNPFSTDVLYLHMTRQLGLGEEFYGTTVSLQAAAAMAASLAYGLYCRRVPLRWLIHCSIVLGILSTVGYWWLAGRGSAVAISLAIGFTYMTATLIQLDLAARVCPPEAGGTAFALLMALTNLGLAASSGAGGLAYQWWGGRWGPQVAFNLLVATGAVFTAGCWLLVPFLRPDRFPREGA